MKVGWDFGGSCLWNRQPCSHGVKSVSHPYHDSHLMTMEARSNHIPGLLGSRSAGTPNLPFGGSDVASYFCDDARPSQRGGGVSRAVINPRFGITV